MLRLALVCLLAAFLAVEARAEACPTKSYNAGFAIVSVDVGGSPINVGVWYPTNWPERRIRYNGTRATGRVRQGLSQAPGSAPIVFLSHGFAASGIAYYTTTEWLARRGWIVVAPDYSDEVTMIRMSGGFNGTFQQALDYVTANPPDPVTYAYRINELQAVLDYFLGGSSTYTIDTEKVALIGHSLGGWTSVQVMAQDARPDALVSWSMGETQWLLASQRVFDATELQAIARPMLWIYGEAEEALVAPEDAYAVWGYANGPTPAFLLEIPNGVHSVYTPNVFGQISGGGSAQQALIQRTTLEFLKAHVLRSYGSVCVTCDASR